MGPDIKSPVMFIYEMYMSVYCYRKGFTMVSGEKVIGQLKNICYNNDKCDLF